MKKLIFYSSIVLFYFTILATLFSFTSREKNGVVSETKAVVTTLPVSDSSANNVNIKTGDATRFIKDNGNVPEDEYRPGKNLPARTLYGTASYYHNKFNGRQTANGEIFSQKKLTGASNFLPLNEWVRVTNLDNNKTVIVKITDRMHPRMTRVIDLSKAAAQHLAYVGNGLTKVKIEPLGKTRPA